MEQVHGELRVREHPAHRRGVDRAHVDGDDLGRHRARPGGLRPASTRRHQRCGPPPAPAGPGPRTGQRNRYASGRPAGRTRRSAHRPATGAGPGGAHRCPRCATRAGGLRQHRVRALRRTPRARPATTGPASRAACATVRPRSATTRPPDPAAAGHPAPRRHRGQRLGERLARARPVLAFSTAASPSTRHRIRPPPHIRRPGNDPLLNPARRRPAIRARTRVRIRGHHPDRTGRSGLTLGVEDPRPPREQPRCHILGTVPAAL